MYHPACNVSKFLAFPEYTLHLILPQRVNNKFIDKVDNYQELKENPVAELIVFAYHGTLRNEMYNVQNGSGALPTPYSRDITGKTATGYSSLFTAT